MSDKYNGWLKADFVREVERLENLVQKLKNENNQMISKEYWKAPKNERGAGRKPKLTLELYNEIKEMRDKNMTYRDIASTLYISLGLVNKACSLPSGELLPSQPNVTAFPADGNLS